MKRRTFIQTTALSAFAVSVSGFSLIEKKGIFSTSCATSTDMLGPFYRKGAPDRTDLTYAGNASELIINVSGRVFGADCKTPIAKAIIDIWHCDEHKDYHMEDVEYKCRGKLETNENGEYSFKTFMPPHYGGRPKHIHYLIRETQGFQQLVTQLYFSGDQKIKPNNWIKYPWDKKRILNIAENSKGDSEVELDLYLTPA